jgi:hypothetical protein
MQSSFHRIVVPVSAAVGLTAALVAIGAPLWLSASLGALAALAALRAALPRAEPATARR